MLVHFRLTGTDDKVMHPVGTSWTQWVGAFV
jgi:hypothetical protein